MAILRLDHIFLIFGVILCILTSIGVFNFTSKFISELIKPHKANVLRQMYDPDLCNATVLCPFATNAYQIHYNRTVCFNKTMHYRYIPWIRFDVWKKFREISDEKRRKRAKVLDVINGEENKLNETQNERENVDVDHDTPAIRKDREEVSKVACTILAALLIVLSIAACAEVFREKFLSKKKNSLEEVNNKLLSADEDINRMSSLTEEQSAEVVQSAKVTQTLLHQTSLDKPFSRLNSEVRPFYTRRASVPSQMITSGVVSNTQDLGCYNDAPFHPIGAPTVRRGSRHLIRRH